MKTIPALSALFLLACVLPAQQPNHATASMVFDGVDGPPWPITGVSFPRGLSSSVTLGGVPGSPFIVAGSASLRPAGLPAFGGLVDLDVASLSIVLDGLADPAFTLDATGSWTAALPIPANAPIGAQGAWQGLFADPTTPIGASLSAATRATVAPGITVTPLVLGNDTFVNVDVSSYGLSLPFYGQSYSSVFVNSNGLLTFTVGTNDFSPTQLEMLAWMPRICGNWSDLRPDSGGAVTLTVDQSTAAPFVQVGFAAVPDNGMLPHDFTMRIYAAPVGDVVISHGLFNNNASQTVAVGITPGWNLSNAGPVDLSAFSTPSAPTNAAIYEGFGPPTPQSGFVGTWDLIGKTLTFSAFQPGTPAATYVASCYP
jgi:hypothetical protein